MTNTPFTDAIAVLKAEHRTVEALFEQFWQTKSPRRRQTLARQIRTALHTHGIVEEEVFYPALRGKVDATMLGEACVRLWAIKRMIADIDHTSPTDAWYEPRIRALASQVAQHIRTAEAFGEGLFARCRRAGVDLVALRDAVVARQQALLTQAVRPVSLRLVAA